MSTLPGTYFDGRSAGARAVSITRAGDEFVIEGDNLRLTHPTHDVRVTPRLGRTRRRIVFPAGGAVEIADDPLLDAWFATPGQRRWAVLARAESHLGIALLALTVVGAVTVAAVFWGLPAVAQRVAFQVPAEWTTHLGKDALRQLDELLGTGTNVSAEQRTALHERFATLAQASATEAQLTFRTWPRLGPNAVALPDGTIVVTDALVDLAEGDDGLLAILAHELGHVRERHGLQRLLASSGVAALLYTITGDVSGMAGITLTAPTILLHLRHSRALERDADRFAFELMDEVGIDPMAFAEIIRKLEAGAAADEGDWRSWLSTHPPTAERARRAERFRANTRRVVSTPPAASDDRERVPSAAP